MTLQMTASQAEKFQIWSEEQDKKVAEKQGNEQAYYGATGGAYTYMYTPTSLGMCLVVRNNITEEEINLTNYEDW